MSFFFCWPSSRIARNSVPEQTPKSESTESIVDRYIPYYARRVLNRLSPYGFRKIAESVIAGFIQIPSIAFVYGKSAAINWWIQALTLLYNTPLNTYFTLDSFSQLIPLIKRIFTSPWLPAAPNLKIFNGVKNLIAESATAALRELDPRSFTTGDALWSFGYLLLSFSFSTAPSNLYSDLAKSYPLVTSLASSWPLTLYILFTFNFLHQPGVGDVLGRFYKAYLKYYTDFVTIFLPENNSWRKARFINKAYGEGADAVLDYLEQVHNELEKIVSPTLRHSSSYLHNNIVDLSNDLRTYYQTGFMTNQQVNLLIKKHSALIAALKIEQEKEPGCCQESAAPSVFTILCVLLLLSFIALFRNSALKLTYDPTKSIGANFFFLLLNIDANLGLGIITLVNTVNILNKLIAGRQPFLLRNRLWPQLSLGLLITAGGFGSIGASLQPAKDLLKNLPPLFYYVTIYGGVIFASGIFNTVPTLQLYSASISSYKRYQALQGKNEPQHVDALITYFSAQTLAEWRNLHPQTLFELITALDEQNPFLPEDLRRQTQALAAITPDELYRLIQPNIPARSETAVDYLLVTSALTAYIYGGRILPSTPTTLDPQDPLSYWQMVYDLILPAIVTLGYSYVKKIIQGFLNPAAASEIEQPLLQPEVPVQENFPGQNIVNGSNSHENGESKIHEPVPISSDTTSNPGRCQQFFSWLKKPIKDTVKDYLGAFAFFTLVQWTWDFITQATSNDPAQNQAENSFNWLPETFKSLFLVAVLLQTLQASRKALLPEDNTAYPAATLQP